MVWRTTVAILAQAAKIDAHDPCVKVTTSPIMRLSWMSMRHVEMKATPIDWLLQTSFFGLDVLFPKFFAVYFAFVPCVMVAKGQFLRGLFLRYWRVVCFNVNQQSPFVARSALAILRRSSHLSTPSFVAVACDRPSLPPSIHGDLFHSDDGICTHDGV